MFKQPIVRTGYKVLAALLVTYVLIGGVAMSFPKMPLLGQTSRAVFYHLPMWVAMYLMLLVSLVYSVRFLRTNNLKDDTHAREAAIVGIFFGVLGLATGILWSRVAWYSTLPDNDFDAWWSWDPKQTSVLVAIIIFAAYLVLRNSVDEMTQRARLGAVYNIFAFVAVIALTYIIPRQMDSLHPGSDAQPGEDTTFAPQYRLVLYPAFLGFALLAVWVLELRVRTARLRERFDEILLNASAANTP